jgi:hypothetical protein
MVSATSFQDWMAGHPHHAEEAFDHRTVPQFFAEPAGTTSGRHEVPYGPAHLWRRVLWGRAGPLRHQRTAELKVTTWRAGEIRGISVYGR